MIEWLTLPIFKEVSEGSEKLNYKTFVVGGFVRDIFLNRPSKDIDFVTLGDGIKLAKGVAKGLNMQDHVNIFKTYGTAHIRSGEWDYEFVGARKESYNLDSRKPTVIPGTLEDDQNRRDFTINTLAIGLNKENYGQLIDPFGGIKDLDDKIIRTPLDPDITFSDDPLRMMRAIRFASQLDFKIESETYEGIRRNAKRLEIVSMERIADELNKIMMSPKPSVGFKLMFNSGLLHEFFPEVVALHGVDIINGMGHKDNFYHTLKVLDNVAELSDNLWLRWAALLHDIAKPNTKKYYPEEGWTFHGHEDKGSRMVKGIFRRLRLPLNEKMKFVEKLVLLHLRPIALTKENITDSAIRRLIFEAGDDMEALLLLCRCDITSKNEIKVSRFLKNLNLVEEKVKDVEERDKVRNWQPPFTGNDIMELFGIGSGREIGKIKTALKEAILEGEITNDYDKAKEFVIEKGRELGIRPIKQPTAHT